MPTLIRINGKLAIRGGKLLAARNEEDARRCCNFCDPPIDPYVPYAPPSEEVECGHCIDNIALSQFMLSVQGLSNDAGCVDCATLNANHVIGEYLGSCVWRKMFLHDGTQSAICPIDAPTGAPFNYFIHIRLVASPEGLIWGVGPGETRLIAQIGHYASGAWGENYIVYRSAALPTPVDCTVLQNLRLDYFARIVGQPFDKHVCISNGAPLFASVVPGP
jgi:hypothetical protein